VVVAIVGSRDYPWPENVEIAVQYLCETHPGWSLVSGGARGVDSWAALAAMARGVEVTEIIPDWNRFGRSAGMIRNREIIARADVVIAFWDGRSHGTKNSIDLARAMSRQLLVVGP
jgi:predicted Rossmann fold nucleotide-binding protein DprA/Smf involved in DNA uptake